MDIEQAAAREAVQQMLRATGLDATGLARRAGVAPSTITRLMAGSVKHTLSARTLAKLARASGVPAPVAGVADHLAAPAPRPPDLPAFGTLPRDLPVHGSAEGGPDGVFELQDASGLAVDMVRRPPGLAGMRNAFALYTAGDSMSPWREPGDLIFIHPDRPAAPGSYVVIVFRPEREGEPRRAMVKRLVRRGAGKVIVEQFNPRKTIDLDAGKIERMWRVIDWQEAMGFG